MGASLAHAEPLYLFGNLPGAAGIFPTNASADPLVKLAAFNTAVDVTHRETFETRPSGLLTGDSFNPPNVMTVFGPGNTLSQSVPGSGLQGARVRSGGQQFGRFNTTNGASSGRWIESDSNIVINLATSVGAFGFFGTDFGDFRGNLTISLYNVTNTGATLVSANVFTDESGTPLQPRTAPVVPVPGDPMVAENGSLLFFGYGSDTAVFNRIIFNVGQGAGALDYLGFDDLLIGNLRAPTPTNMPEPGSLALVGLALMGAGLSRRKSQQQA